jgi:hypothetical protein
MIAFFGKILGRSWLRRVYKVNKPLFFIVSIFFAATIASNIIRLQTTPFFVWDMYSRKIPETDAYPYYEIRYNDNRLINLRHTWNEPEKTFLYGPINLYIADKNDPGSDNFHQYLNNTWRRKHPGFAWLTGNLTLTRAELDAFPAWLKKYVSTVTGQHVDSLVVLKKMMHFDALGEPVVRSSDTVLHIPAKP